MVSQMTPPDLLCDVVNAMSNTTPPGLQRTVGPPGGSSADCNLSAFSLWGGGISPFLPGSANAERNNLRQVRQRTNF